MIQKEFARKLQAYPGQRNYRAISVITQHCFNIQELFDVDRKAFDPEPAIASVVIRLTPKKSSITEQIIKSLDILFSQKNKKTSSLVNKFGIGVNLASKRINELDAEELVELARGFTTKL
jgi:16S rRNA (adenine1518-N6/adenine1519-N6)-dimethyltransferase